MTTLLMLVLFQQVPAGPLDAFRANFASIKADVDYTFEFGTADSSTMEGGAMAGRGHSGSLRGRPAVHGRWSYDGRVERCRRTGPRRRIARSEDDAGKGRGQGFRSRAVRGDLRWAGGRISPNQR